MLRSDYEGSRRVMKLIFVLIFAVLAAAIFFLRNKQEAVITGSMTIQKMLCQENDDQTVTFSLAAFNTTNQRLNNLNVGLNVANDNDSRQKTINMRLVEEGDIFDINNPNLRDNKV